MNLRLFDALPANMAPALALAVTQALAPGGALALGGENSGAPAGTAPVPAEPSVPSAPPAPAAGQETAETAIEQCGRLPEGVESHACFCQASAAEARESVWGADPFTADSSICAAALLTGYLVEGEPGVVHVLRLQGLESYSGASLNGVTSQSWGSYDSSFVFDWNR